MTPENPRLDAVKISEWHEDGRLVIRCLFWILALYIVLDYMKPLRDYAAKPDTAKTISDTLIPGAPNPYTHGAIHHRIGAPQLSHQTKDAK